MNKKTLISLVIFLALLVIFGSVIFFIQKQNYTPVTGTYNGMNEDHKLLGYYSTYQSGSTTCPVFAASAGDVDFIIRSGYTLPRNGPVIFNISLADLNNDQRVMLMNSKDSPTGYVYLSVEDKGEKPIDSDYVTYSCKSFVKMTSVVPMISGNSNNIVSSSSSDFSEYIGVISTTTDGQHLYASKKYGLQFEYPQGWYVGDNQLGYGTLQFFNYDESTMERGELTKSYKLNKIEASIGNNSHYGTSDIYPEKMRDAQSLKIAGQSATRESITFNDGARALFYSIPIPQLTGTYFDVVIYGNASNFSVLDNLMSTLYWVK